MLFLPKSHHKKLFDDCYPPPKAIVATAPEYRPNANELSRLCYYAHNKPAKLAKVGALLIARNASDTRGLSGSSSDRAKAGAMLTLSILQELANTSSEGHSYLAQPMFTVLSDTFRAAAPNVGASGWELDLITRTTTTFDTYVSGLPAGVMDVDANVQRAVAAGIEDMRLASGMRSRDTVFPATQYTRFVALYGLDGMFRAPALNTSQYENIISRAVPILVLNLSPLHVTLPTAQHAAASTTSTAARIAQPTVGVEPSDEDLAQSAAALLRFAVRRASFTRLRAITSAVIGFISEANLWNESKWVSWLLTQLLRWGQSMSRYVVPLTCVDHLSSQDTRQGPALMLAVRTMLGSQSSLAGLNMRELLDKYTDALLGRVQHDPNDRTISPLIETIGSFGTGAGSEQAGVLVRDIHMQMAALQKGTGKNAQLKPLQRNNSIRALLYALVAIVRVRSTEQHTRLSLSSWEPSMVVLTSSDPMVRYTYLSALEVFITVELGSSVTSNVMHTLHTYAAGIVVLLSAGIVPNADTVADVRRLGNAKPNETITSVPADFVGAAATLDELYERMTVPAVIATLPALIALDRLASIQDAGAFNYAVLQRRVACRQLVGHVLAKLGAVCNAPDIVAYADSRIRNHVGDLRLQAPSLPAEFGPTQALSDFAAESAELGPAAEDVNEIAQLVARLPGLQAAMPAGQSIQSWMLRDWNVSATIDNAQYTTMPSAARSASTFVPRSTSSLSRGVSMTSGRAASRTGVQRQTSISVGQLRSVLLGGNSSGAPQDGSAVPSGTVPGHLADQSFDTLGTDSRSTATVRIRRRDPSIRGNNSLSRHRSVISMLDRYSGVEETPVSTAV